MLDPDLLALHHALVEGDPTASRDFVNACSPRLYPILKRRYGFLPREDVEDAVNDALLAVIGRPELYDPARGSLMNLLVWIGSNKLCDQIRRLKRRAEVPVGGVVELEELEAKQITEGDYAEMESGSIAPEVEALLAEILPDPRDRRAWELVCDGRTSVEEFAKVFGLDGLPPEELKAEVKRNRDRVIKRVQRRREDFGRYLL